MTRTRDTVENVDYFANHALVVRWPFTEHPHPIERSLATTIHEVRTTFTSPLRVLVFGCDNFHEQHLYPPETEFIMVGKAPRLHEARQKVVANSPGNAAHISRDHHEFAEIAALYGGTIHLITAQDVIEYIADMEFYFPLFKKLLAPGGILWLSTPNCGDLPLLLVESTFTQLRAFSPERMRLNQYLKDKLKKERNKFGFSGAPVANTSRKRTLTSDASKEHVTI